MNGHVNEKRYVSRIVLFWRNGKKAYKRGGYYRGIFSVQVGDDRQEYYYSNGNAGTAVLKERYDNTYQMFMTLNEIVFRDYTPGMKLFHTLIRISYRDV